MLTTFYTPGEAQVQNGKHETILALLIILAFVCFAIPRLHLPFFWDASWVYGPAIFEMSKGIPSLLPDSIDVNIGRGHPLMFHFLGAIWAKVFGFSALSLNVFMLLISVAVLYMVFLFGRSFFGEKAGLIALVIVATQEMFIAQALQVLPEMMLALFVLTTTYTYLHQRYFLYILSGTALLLTKETGVVVIAALAVVHVLKVVFVAGRQKWLRTLFIEGLWIAAPVIIASSHYIYQKIAFGWYFFPEHLESQIWNLNSILYRLRDVFDLIFMWQGRLVITVIALASLCIWFVRKKLWHGILLFSSLIIMYQIFYVGYSFSIPLRFILPIICFIGIVIFALIPYLRKNHRTGLAVNTLVIYLALFMAFNAINLLTSRYVLNGLPIYALLCGWVISRFISKRWMLIPILIIPILLLVDQLRQERLIRDINLTYADGVNMYLKIADYFSNEAIKPCTVMGTLLEAVAMGDPRACYVEKPTEGVTVVIQRDTTKLIEGSVDYLINSNVLEYVNLPKSDSACCSLVKEIKVGHAHAEIYSIRQD